MPFERTMGQQELYRQVSEKMPSRARNFAEDEQMIRWGMLLLELADEHGNAAVRKALDRHNEHLANTPTRYPKDPSDA
ncbi:MAG: hypothetical protein ABI548_01595 [Polyangiaceae bacterium]